MECTIKKGKELTREDIINHMIQDEKQENIEFLEKTDQYYTVFDFEDEKEITYTFPEIITKDFIQNKIIISKKIKHKYSMKEETIADILFRVLGKDYFTVLNKIYIIYNNYDISKMVEAEDMCDESKDYFQDFYSQQVGLTYVEKNIAIINFRLIEKITRQTFGNLYCFDDELITGFYSTIFHELRHLLLDCHHYISEELYPLELSSEENVEKFGNYMAEKHINILKF